jgi:hypothetical protein
MRLQGFPLTIEAIQIKGQDIACSLNISEDQFKGSMGWCKRMMCRNGPALRRRTTLAQRLTKEFDEKLLSFQRYIICQRKKHDYPLNLVGNAY